MFNKKFFFTTTLILGAVSAQAATTGSITISGSVAASTAIVVTAQTGYNNLDLSASPADQQVATVREINNTTNGYVVKLSSANAGKLKNGSSASLNYTAKYNGSSVTLSTTPVTVTTAAASTTVVNVVKSFNVSYTGLPADQMLAGTYSDTLTFTITAN